jgi:hypothetical protein
MHSRLLSSQALRLLRPSLRPSQPSRALATASATMPIQLYSLATPNGQKVTGRSTRAEAAHVGTSPSRHGLHRILDDFAPRSPKLVAGISCDLQLLHFHGPVLALYGATPLAPLGIPSTPPLPRLWHPCRLALL